LAHPLRGQAAPALKNIDVGAIATRTRRESGFSHFGSLDVAASAMARKKARLVPKVTARETKSQLRTGVFVPTRPTRNADVFETSFVDLLCAAATSVPRRHSRTSAD